MGAFLFLNCSTRSHRPYYDRELGGYVTGTSSGKEKIKKSGENKKSPEDSKEYDSLNQDSVVTSEPQEASDVRIKKLVKAARSYIGVPYRWAGTTRKGMDCSGLMMTVFKQTLNIKLPRSSKEQSKVGVKVARENLKAGDLVFFGGFSVDHVGMYLKDNQFIHAATSRGVVISDLTMKYYVKRYKGGRRLIP